VIPLKLFLAVFFTAIVTFIWTECHTASSCDDDNTSITHIAGKDYFCADYNSTVEVFRRLKANQAKGPQA